MVTRTRQRCLTRIAGFRRREGLAHDCTAHHPPHLDKDPAAMAERRGGGGCRVAHRIAGERGTGGRRRGRRSADVYRVYRAVPAAVPFLPGAELDERSERVALLPGGVPPVLSVQPFREHVGQHVVGSRREHGPGALDPVAGRDPQRQRRDDLLRQRGGRLQEHHWLWRAGQPGDGCGLHPGPAGRNAAAGARLTAWTTAAPSPSTVLCSPRRTRRIRTRRRP